MRGFDFVNKPGLQPGDCNSLFTAAPASETASATSAGHGAAAEEADADAHVDGVGDAAEGAQRKRRR